MIFPAGCEHFQTKNNDLPYKLLPIPGKKKHLPNKNKNLSDRLLPPAPKNIDRKKKINDLIKGCVKNPSIMSIIITHH